ncbi:hypothetical protein BDN70DRAFT_375815 [Pholiota conissans]|uniref:Uncharacterized protein n=1 Tax=Pholiota conissans TaxID=109636 RepID=A0A9P5YR30_9AGAR|nr:hypothetical protein BDN70DRAFT_375815 [Pholiota conissans]
MCCSDQYIFFPSNLVRLVGLLHPSSNQQLNAQCLVFVHASGVANQVNATTLAAFPITLDDVFVVITAPSFIKAPFYHIAVVESVPGIPLFLQPSLVILTSKDTSALSFQERNTNNAGKIALKNLSTTAVASSLFLAHRPLLIGLFLYTSLARSDRISIAIWTMYIRKESNTSIIRTGDYGVICVYLRLR